MKGTHSCEWCGEPIDPATTKSARARFCSPHRRWKHIEANRPADLSRHRDDPEYRARRLAEAKQHQRTRRCRRCGEPSGARTRLSARSTRRRPRFDGQPGDARRRRSRRPPRRSSGLASGSGRGSGQGRRRSRAATTRRSRGSASASSESSTRATRSVSAAASRSGARRRGRALGSRSCRHEPGADRGAGTPGLQQGDDVARGQAATGSTEGTKRLVSERSPSCSTRRRSGLSSASPARPPRRSCGSLPVVQIEGLRKVTSVATTSPATSRKPSRRQVRRTIVSSGRASVGTPRQGSSAPAPMYPPGV